MILMHFLQSCLTLRRPGAELFQLFVRCMFRRGLAKQVFQVMVYVYIVCLGSFNYRINKGAGVGTIRCVGEKPVFAAGHERLAASLAGVVMKTAAAVLKVGGQELPSVPYIDEGLIQPGVLNGSLGIKLREESIKDGHFLFEAVFLYVVKSYALFCMDPVFHVKELVDIDQSLYGRLGMIVLSAFRDGIDKIPPDMRPA